MATLLLNPAKRRRARKSRKARSPAQRAATRKMLAANRARSPARKRRSRRAVVHHNPVARRRSRRYRRNPAGRMRSGFNRVRSSGHFNLLKQGAMLGVGAVAVDILFGQLARFLPASMITPMNTDGSTNWMYFAAKSATAIGVAHFGKRVLPARFAESAGVGSLAIMSYQIARSMVPSALTMGAYVNPGRVMAPRMAGLRGGAAPALGAYVSAAPGGAMRTQMASRVGR